jgi:hypothetical protein
MRTKLNKYRCLNNGSWYNVPYRAFAEGDVKCKKNVKCVFLLGHCVNNSAVNFFRILVANLFQSEVVLIFRLSLLF